MMAAEVAMMKPRWRAIGSLVQYRGVGGTPAAPLARPVHPQDPSNFAEPACKTTDLHNCNRAKLRESTGWRGAQSWESFRYYRYYRYHRFYRYPASPEGCMHNVSLSCMHNFSLSLLSMQDLDLSQYGGDLDLSQYGGGGSITAMLLGGVCFVAGRWYERLGQLQRHKSERDQQATEMKDSFSAISAEALTRSQQQLLNLAEENFKRFLSQGQYELRMQQNGLKELVQPLQNSVDALERSRLQAFSKLEAQLETVAGGQVQLKQETSKLVNSLRRPEVRGRWGELTLQRLAELSGMVEHCDFYMQPTFASRDEQTEGKSSVVRPDMVVRLPNDREVVVDAKTPLDAYLNALEASDAAQREAELVRHAGQVRKQVRALASKAYWSHLSKSPDFVVLFLPGEQFLSAALEHDATLLEDALASRVVIATPSSLIALLWAVAAGWRQENLTDGLAQVQGIGRDLHTRAATLLERTTKLGKSLGSAVESYNSMLGSLERQFIPKARQLESLGIKGKKSLPELDQLERVERVLQAAASDEPT
eukprot:g4009.t1